ncbi:FAD-dependent monooxygenase [Halorubrum halodurans]|uniref:Zeaxanthin epoxidase n=1 Tax=Halorubrum halodurans TaxID=1383851 RepID=A0A256ICH9_9EURY|nr:FAD-dependent monooxygenase [Halorubrum halodurans]OYR54254.1 zeaxanthin epoxidase [Halorubrum halodurans]
MSNDSPRTTSPNRPPPNRPPPNRSPPNRRSTDDGSRSRPARGDAADRGGHDRDVAVVGGGICGLTTALALERHGRSPTVYEAASEYEPVGAGILLQTNAMLVLDRLGIADAVREAGTRLDEGGLRSLDGEFMVRFDLDALERREFGYGFVAVHRADLQRILLDELDADVRTGMDCVAVDGSDPPVARFDDGTEIRPDVLVGADGIHSTVRDAVAPETSPRALDGVAYRALVSLDVPEAYRTRGFEVWGDGAYTGGSPVDANRFYWFATAPDRLTDDRADPGAVSAALRSHLAGYPEPIPAILAALDPADLVVTDLADLPPLDTWSRDRVVLAGDAAHAMLPFAGQGAAQAIEDGVMLADALATAADHERAFEAYEADRKPRADRLRDASHRLGRLGTIQSALGCRLRNLVIDAVPDAAIRRVRRRQAAGTSLPNGHNP